MNMGERLFWTGEERRAYPRRLLLLIPSVLTLVPVGLGLLILWMLLSPTGFSGVFLSCYVLLVFVLPFCIPLIAAEFALWFSTLYVCEAVRYTTAKTVLCCIMSPLALIVVVRYVWFACEILREIFRPGMR